MLRKSIYCLLTLLFISCSSENISIHSGRYEFHDFLSSTFYTFENDEDEFYYFDFGQVGPNSGTFFYKDGQDELIMFQCEKDGFTKEECETTASFDWENKNLYRTIKFNNISCAAEMNEVVEKYVTEYIDSTLKFAYPNTGPFTDTYEKIEFYVPALSNKTPHDFLSFGVWGYFSSGGTMRVPYWKSYTFDLKSCLQVDYTTAFNLNYEALEEKILEYALISDLTDQSLIVSSYRFDEDYFKNSIFFNSSTLYIPFLNCGEACWTHLYINDPDELEKSQEEYRSKYERCSEPSFWEVPCNTWLTNKFSGFVAIPLKDLVSNG